MLRVNHAVTIGIWIVYVRIERVHALEPLWIGVDMFQNPYRTAAMSVLTCFLLEQQ